MTHSGGKPQLMNDRRLIAVWLRRARQALCSHRFYFDDLKRINDDLVRCPCFRCEKVCEATYGLALDGSFVGHRVGSNPPPPVGAKPLPPPGPPPVYPPMPQVKPPGSAIIAPLTADDVRKIVREEIESAMRPAWKSGRMGPG